MKTGSPSVGVKLPPRNAKIVTTPPENTVVIVSLSKRIVNAVRNAATAPTQMDRLKAMSSIPGQNAPSVRSNATKISDDKKNRIQNCRNVMIAAEMALLPK